MPITNPDILKQAEAYLNPASTETSPVEVSSVPERGLLEDVWQGAQAGGNRLAQSGRETLKFLADYSDNPDHIEYSRYNDRKANAAMKRAQELEKDLGVAGMVGNMAVQSLPTAASFVLPGGIPARMAAAAATGGVQEFGDIMGRFREEGKEADAGAAGTAALGAAAWDATVGRFLPAGASPVRRVASDAISGALSGAGHNAASNLATGNPWDLNLGMAAVGGGVAGGGLSGMNAALGFGLNKGGQKATTDLRQLREANNNVNPTEDFQTAYFEQANANEGFKEAMTTAKTPEELQSALQSKLNSDAQYGAAPALVRSQKLADKHKIPLTDASLNWEMKDLTNQNSYGNAGEAVGVSRSNQEKALRKNAEVTPAGIRTTSAQRAGETTVSHQDGVKKAGVAAMAEARGVFETNRGYIEDVYKSGSRSGELSPELEEKYKWLLEDLSTLEKTAFAIAEGKKADVGDNLVRAARRSYELATELGELKNLKGLEGEFEPILDTQAMDYLERSLVSEYPSFHQGSPDVAKEKAPRSVTSGDLAGGIVFSPLYTAGMITGRSLKNNIGGVLKQRGMRKRKEQAASQREGLRSSLEQRLANRPKKPTLDEELSNGSLSGAAATAQESLQQDLQTIPEPETSVLDEPTPIATPEAPVSTPEPSFRTSGAVTPPKIENAPEPVVEAPEAPAPKMVDQGLAKRYNEKVKEVQKAEEELQEDLVAAEELDNQILEAQDTQVNPKAVSQLAALSSSINQAAEAKALEVQRMQEELAAMEAEANKAGQSFVKAPKPREAAPSEELNQPTEAEEKAPTEAPTEAPEPAPKKERVPITKPYKDKVEEITSIPYAQRTPEQVKELHRNKEDLKKTNEIFDRLATQTREERELLEGIAEDNNINVLNDKDAPGKIKNALREMRDKKKAEGLKFAKDLAAKTKATLDSSKPSKETAEQKAATRLARKVSDMDKWNETYGVPEDVRAEALRRMGVLEGEDFNVQTLRKEQEKIMKESSEEDPAEVANTNREDLMTLGEELLGEEGKKLVRLQTGPKGEVSDAKYNQIYRKLYEVLDKKAEAAKKLAEETEAAAKKEAELLEEASKKAKMDAKTKAVRDRLVKQKEEAAAEAKAEEERLKDLQEKAKANAKQLAEKLRERQKAEDLRQEAIKNVAELAKQQAKITKVLKDKGLKDVDVDNFLDDNFSVRTKPLPEGSYQALVRKANHFKSETQAVDAAAEAARVEVERFLDSSDAESAKGLLNAFIEDFSTLIADGEAGVKALSEQLKAFEEASAALKQQIGNDHINTAKVIVNVIDKAEAMKKAFPDNPEYWVTFEDYEQMLRTYQKHRNIVDGSSSIGRWGKRLRAAVYGKDSLVELHTKKSIKEAIEKEGGEVPKELNSGVSATIRKLKSGKEVPVRTK